MYLLITSFLLNKRQKKNERTNNLTKNLKGGYTGSSLLVLDV